jgi:hypothetical protein
MSTSCRVLSVILWKPEHETKCNRCNYYDLNKHDDQTDIERSDFCMLGCNVDRFFTGCADTQIVLHFCPWASWAKREIYHLLMCMYLTESSFTSRLEKARSVITGKLMLVTVADINCRRITIFLIALLIEQTRHDIFTVFQVLFESSVIESTHVINHGRVYHAGQLLKLIHLLKNKSDSK